MTNHLLVWTLVLANTIGGVCSMQAVAGLGTGSQGYGLLLKNYYRLGLVSEAEKAAQALYAEAEATVITQADAALSVWKDGRIFALRRSLVDGYGDGAKEAFEAFVSVYSESEASNDPDFLSVLKQALGVEQVGGYGEIRQLAMAHWIGDEMAQTKVLLSEMETWLMLMQDEEIAADLPPLDIWLTRNVPAAGPTELREAPPPKRRRSLRDAEGSSGSFVQADTSSANPLDTLSDLKSERRADALRQAETGMAMVAAERQAAEEERAAKIVAAAQADATALKKQAMTLAAAEKEAMGQRENSWGNRLKKIVGATVTAAGGTFFGHVGAEAGRAAVDAVF